MKEIEFPIKIGATVVHGRILPAVSSRGLRRDSERDAVRRLVSEVFGSDAVLEHDEFGAPSIVGFDGSISISHGAGYVLLAVNRDAPIGIDIEAYRPSLPYISSRFMTAGELAEYGCSPRMILWAWTAKEALFKAAGNPELTMSSIFMPDEASSNRVELEGAIYNLTFIERTPFTIALAERINK